MARIHHADVWGTREAKYQWLLAHDLEHTEWRELNPVSPFYLFVPRDDALAATYQRFPSVPDVFPVNSVGIVTARDRLTVHWTPEEVWKTVTVFSRMAPDLARQGYELGEDARDWKVELAQKDLLDSGLRRENIVPVLYRPFDLRHTYYTGRSRGFICMPRPEVMSHMLAGENVAVAVGRAGQVIGSDQWNLIFCTGHMTEFNLYRRGGNNLFPLYIYPTGDRADLFAHHDASERRPNLNPAVASALAAAYGREPEPEEIFHYVYAVLYAPSYRAKYAEFLRTDFPRIPFTSDAALFSELAALGARLVGLHLLKSRELDPPICRFDGSGDGRIGKGAKAGLRYEPSNERVYINATQYFAPVPKEVWEYQVGGYQVCRKWLNDRKERSLGADEVRTYCRIVTALKLTLDIQHEIDAFYPQAEAATVSLSES